jgi:ABC-type phosphate transport system auxiliary subunit
MPKVLAGCHYNEEEISRHLKNNIGYWPVQMNGNKFATGQMLEKTSRSCEGVDFNWLISKVSQTLHSRRLQKTAYVILYMSYTSQKYSISVLH